MEDTRSQRSYLVFGWDLFWRNHINNTNPFHKFIRVCRAFFAETYARNLSVKVKGLESPKILEVGCGSGETLRKLREACSSAKYFGLDFSRVALEATKTVNPGCFLVRGDAFHLPFRGEAFDLVYSTGLIEHFPRDEATELLCEKARVTKTTGTLVAVVPSRYSAIDLMKNLKFSPLWIWHFLDGCDFPFTREELVELFKQAKLDHVRVTSLHFNVFLVSCLMGY